MHSSTCCFLEHPLLIWSTVTSEFFRKLFADFGSMSVWQPHVFSSHYVHLFQCFTLTLHLHLIQIFSGHPFGIWEPCSIGSRPVTWHSTLSPFCGHMFREHTEGFTVWRWKWSGSFFTCSEAPSLSPIAENATFNIGIVDELNSQVSWEKD